jgi:hypothetical protein
LLPFVFADAEDERAQYTMLIGQVAARLRRDAVPAGDEGAIRVRGVDSANDKIIRTFGDLITLLEAELGDEGTRGSWVAGSAVTGSVNALLRRLRSAVRPLSAVIRGDLAHRGERSITTSRAQVTVVDLHNLPDRAQRFVVGVTLRGEFARKERQGTARPLMFVMLDELNKYAPRDGDSPIKQILLDVAERGRSLGVILIGAQQTARKSSGGSCRTARSGSRADWTPRKPNALSTGTCHRLSDSARPWPNRARCSSPSLTSRCPSPWISRSPRGPPAPAKKANGPVTTPARPGLRTPLPPSPALTTTRHRSRAGPPSQV